MNHLLNITKNTIPVFLVAMQRMTRTNAAAPTSPDESATRRFLCLDELKDLRRLTKNPNVPEEARQFARETLKNIEKYDKSLPMEFVKDPEGLGGTIRLRTNGFTTQLIKPAEEMQSSGRRPVLPEGLDYIKLVDAWTFEELDWKSKEDVLHGNRLIIKSKTDSVKSANGERIALKDVLIFKDEDTANDWWTAINNGVQRSSKPEYESLDDRLRSELEAVHEYIETINKVLESHDFPRIHLKPKEGAGFSELYFKKLAANFGTSPEELSEIDEKWNEACDEVMKMNELVSKNMRTKLKEYLSCL